MSEILLGTFDGDANIPVHANNLIQIKKELRAKGFIIDKEVPIPSTDHTQVFISKDKDEIWVAISPFPVTTMGPKLLLEDGEHGITSNGVTGKDMYGDYFTIFSAIPKTKTNKANSSKSETIDLRKNDATDALEHAVHHIAKQKQEKTNKGPLQKYIYFENIDPTEVIEWVNSKYKEGYELMGPISITTLNPKLNYTIYSATMIQVLNNPV